MSITYNALVSAVLEEAEDDSSEFLAYIPKAIARAEIKLTRALDTYGFIVYASTNMSAGDPYITIPSGTFIIQSVDFETSTGARTNLIQVTEEYLKDYWPIRTSTGEPKYYARRGNTGNIIVAATPASAWNNEWSVIKQPTPLTSAVQTNFFTSHAEEGLFYFTMCEMMDFAKNPKMYTQYQANANLAVEAMKTEARRNRQDANINNTSPEGSGNTVEQGSQ